MPPRFWTKTHASSKTDQWATPQKVFDKYNAKHRFTLDACASAANTKCRRFFTKATNGLTQDWGRERVWCNPPYGRGLTGLWVEKAYRASRAGAKVVMLLPARTDTRWWHRWAKKGKVEFVEGRLKFGDGRSPAPFPSVVVVFTPPKA